MRETPLQVGLCTWHNDRTVSCCSYWDVESLGVDGLLEGPRIRLLPDGIKDGTKGRLQFFFGEHCRKQVEWEWWGWTNRRQSTTLGTHLSEWTT